jgi:hypothetical protein
MLYPYIYKDRTGRKVYSFKPLDDKNLELVFQIKTKQTKSKKK